MNKRSVSIALLALVTAIATSTTVWKARTILSPAKSTLPDNAGRVDNLQKIAMTECILADANLERTDKGLILYYSGANDVIRLANGFLHGKNITLISVDDEIVSGSNPMTSFLVRNQADATYLVPKYQLKPSRHTIKLMRSDRSVYAEIPIEIVYRYDASRGVMNTSLWDVKFKENFESGASGITLCPNNDHPRGYNAITFGRRFEKDLDLEFDFTPLGAPLTFTVNLSQGTQVALGDKGPRSVRLIKTMLRGKDRVEKSVRNEKFSRGFAPGTTYTVRIKRIGVKYTVDIGEKGSNVFQDVLSYSDDHPENNLREKYKGVVFSVWRGSRGVTVTRVIIKG